MTNLKEYNKLKQREWKKRLLADPERFAAYKEKRNKKCREAGYSDTYTLKKKNRCKKATDKMTDSYVAMMLGISVKIATKQLLKTKRKQVLLRREIKNQKAGK